MESSLNSEIAIISFLCIVHNRSTVRYCYLDCAVKVQNNKNTKIFT